MAEAGSQGRYTNPQILAEGKENCITIYYLSTQTLRHPWIEDIFEIWLFKYLSTYLGSKQ